MALSRRIVGVVMALFILGSIGGTAVVMASNQTNYTGAPTEVILLWCVAVPMMAGVSVMMYFIPNRAVSYHPLLVVAVAGTRAKSYITRLLHKLGRD